jgi:hypothetical protein
MNRRALYWHVTNSYLVESLTTSQKRRLALQIYLWQRAKRLDYNGQGKTFLLSEQN